MKLYLIFILLFIVPFFSNSQIKLNADGKFNTYELINSVLIDKNRTAVEVPDCNHTEFGKHISEKFDTTLNKYVFEFVIHTKEDNDRCKRFDRQRNEIKANKRSPNTILATENETLNYKWKFKLEKGFQVSSKYTDVHQITYRKKNGNEPLFAFIAREKKGKDLFQIAYINTSKKEILASVNLSKVTGKWLIADETITYAKNGSYRLKLTTLNGKPIFDIQKENIKTWFETMVYARPKWGIYRSLKKADQLRDEKLYFSDFEINAITK